MENSSLTKWGGNVDLDMVLEKRHSVRSYTSMAPSDTNIQRILKAAELAPSAGNLRARKMFVIRSQSKRDELVEAANGQLFIAEAPFLIIFCADHRAIEKYGSRGKELYCIQDASASAQNALLKATDLGLGTCWIGSFDEERVKEICGLPEGLRPVVMVTIGYEK